MRKIKSMNAVEMIAALFIAFLGVSSLTIGALLLSEARTDQSVAAAILPLLFGFGLCGVVVVKMLS